VLGLVCFACPSSVEQLSACHPPLGEPPIHDVHALAHLTMFSSAAHGPIWVLIMAVLHADSKSSVQIDATQELQTTPSKMLKKTGNASLESGEKESEQWSVAPW